MKSKLSLVFYTLLLSSFLILFFPTQFKVAGYSLSILGWIWILIFIPSTVFLLIWLVIKDINKRNWSDLIIRGLIFITILTISVGYWILKVKS
jgi:hypothetical protein